MHPTSCVFRITLLVSNSDLPLCQVRLWNDCNLGFKLRVQSLFQLYASEIQEAVGKYYDY
jgi:hypothetical protein